jgi:hypothetical protein
MTRKITVSTPEICAQVREWDERRKRLGSLSDAIRRWKADVRKNGRAKAKAKELGISTGVLYYILKNGGTLKSYRGK